MDIEPLHRNSLSDEVYARLVQEILAGGLQPGETLASERELAEMFGVNRHAVREALKRVQQTGLVRIAQGGKTRVLDWRAHAGLEVLAGLANSESVPPERLLLDIAVMRRTVAADAARLCAEQASDEQVAEVVSAADAYPEQPADFPELFAADQAYWRAVVAGSGNVAYQLAFNTLVREMTEIGPTELGKLPFGEEFSRRDAHTALASRIAERDAEGAQAAAAELLGLVVETLFESQRVGKWST